MKARMTYANSDFELTLTAAAGDDPSLMAELRAGFMQSLTGQVELLRRSRCDANWRITAERLRGLGASFHAGELITLAQEAIDGAPGDPAVLRKLGTLTSRFSVTN